MLSSLVKALQNPACYPHDVSEIEVIETQVSWVILTGEYAYKLKKELDFGFLDFSTIEKRQFYCEEELRLNQRLAPDIYQVVVAVTGTLDNPSIALEDHRYLQSSVETNVSEELNVLEYAVRMQQFDPNDSLDKLMEQNKFDSKWIDQLADQLSHFHLQQPTVTTNSPWGEAENVWQLVSDNYLHTLDFCHIDDDLDQLSTLYAQTTEQFLALTDTFKERRRLGFIRECHGDLHLGNVTFFNQQLRLFDCIEFNLQFRWIDTCSDLAFLLMDLEAYGKFNWANRALNRYLEVTGDYQCLLLLNFYKCFRSMVRAKIATLGEQANHDDFLKYLHLSQAYQKRNTPQLILMHGISGSGKSFLSERIIESSRAIRIRSQTERKRLHKDLQRKGKKVELHGPEINARLSQHLITLTEQLLRQGCTVIVDGTFLKQHFRQKYINIAENLNVPFKIISCLCDNKLMEARLKSAVDSRFNNISLLLQRFEYQLENQQILNEFEAQYQHKVYTDSDQSIKDFVTQFSV